MNFSAELAKLRANMFPRLWRVGLRERLVAAATAFVFVFYVNYLPVHLAADHAHDPHEESAEHWHDPGHAGHDQHHIPHPATEHELQLLAKSKQNLVGFVFLGTEAEVQLSAPTLLCVASENSSRTPIRSRGPAPTQPRAPPQS